MSGADPPISATVLIGFSKFGLVASSFAIVLPLR